MQTITISIGRNVGDPIDGSQPRLLSFDWDDFIDDVRELVTDLAHDIYFSGRGAGVFDGKHEDSYTTVFSYDEEHTGPFLDAKHGYETTVQYALATLAAHYNQSSIAVTIGATHLVEAL